MNEQLKRRFAEAVKLQESGQFESARKLLVDLAEQDTKSRLIMVTLGHVYWEMGALDEAANVFRRAIEIAPTWETASLGLFHMLWKLGRRVEALEEVKRFQSISDSEDYEALINEINEKW